MIPKKMETMGRSLPDYKKLYLLGIFFYCAAACAQTTLPDNKKTEPVSSIVVKDKPDIRERLVKLAMQNPDFEIADRKVNIANYQVKKAKNSWLGTVAVQGNLNEFAFRKEITGANGVTYNPSTFYPKYNIGANIPFDLFSTKKNDINIAKENLSIAEAEKNQHYRELKAQVLTKYEDFLLCQQRLDLQSQVTQDARTAYLSAEKDFQDGAIKQDEYNRSYRGYTDEKLKQAEYQRNYNVVKLEIEAMIGISMEDLLKK